MLVSHQNKEDYGPWVSVWFGVRSTNANEYPCGLVSGPPMPMMFTAATAFERSPGEETALEVPEAGQGQTLLCCNSRLLSSRSLWSSCLYCSSSFCFSESAQ